MKRFLFAAMGAALALTGMAVTAPTAAADVNCTGSIGAQSFDDTLYVPRNATCTLNGTYIDGDIKVAPGATLNATGVTVAGNIQTDNGSHRHITVKDSVIDGNIQLEDGGGSTLTGNRVNGDIQLFGNSTGTKEVVSNRVGGNIQCKSNTPAPTGHSNIVGGNAEDQCRGFDRAGGGGGTVDVYITPGYHNVNGRQWHTTCQPYSQTERCTTNIHATVVTYSNGRFRATNDWTFNNLTYKASPRSLWAKNPLGAYGVVGGSTSWNSEGRQWRTECDTSTTGRGGCRSYVTARVIEAYRSGSGYRYRWVTKEVFNNMVRFS